MECDYIREAHQGLQYHRIFGTSIVVRVRLQCRQTVETASKSVRSCPDELLIRELTMQPQCSLRYK